MVKYEPEKLRLDRKASMTDYTTLHYGLKTSSFKGSFRNVHCLRLNFRCTKEKSHAKLSANQQGEIKPYYHIALKTDLSNMIIETKIFKLLVIL